MYKLFASLFLVTVLQVANAQTINDLTAEYKPLIEERHRTLGLDVGVNGMLFGQTNGALGTNIVISYSNITDDLVKLENLVNLSEAQAKSENRNIDTCVAALRVNLSGLNFGEIQACRALPQLGQAKLKLVQLGWLQRDLGNVLPKCLVSTPLDITQIRSCIDEELARIDNGITATITELKSLLDISSSIGNQCIDTKRNQWEEQVSVTESDFRACVGAN